MDANYLASTIKLFAHYKGLTDKTFLQLSEADVKWRPNDASNSIEIIVHHICGNILSRFTDFLHTDGEKPWRNRDAEFSEGYNSKTEMIAAWESAWKTLFVTLRALEPDDLEKVVYIRNEGHTVYDALNRQLAHYAGHIGQIIYMAKAMRGADFQSLTIPKGASKAFNIEKFSIEKSEKHFTDNA